MLIQSARSSYNDDIVSTMDKLLFNSTFCFECLQGLNPDKQVEVLKTARDIYNQRDKIRTCSICHHSELIIDEWVRNNLCLDCSRIRNNRNRVEEILNAR